ncbi:serine protease [Verrucomicrobiaceae bacterium 227]
MKCLLPLLLLLLASCSEPKPPAPEIPSYQTLHHERLNGTFFHFDHEGELFLACSIHQGGNAKGTLLTRHHSPETATIGKQIHHQKDLRVLTFQSDTLDQATALPYSANPAVSMGDEVAILNRGQILRGTIVKTPGDNDHHYYLKTAKTFPANGMSGSPVFSKRLGTVVGVLQTANSKTAANIGGFEILQMP